MQWDSSPNAGFTPVNGKAPWLPLAAGWRTDNVAEQLKDPRSLLNLYRDLLALRRERPALQLGSFRSVRNVPDDVLAYERVYGDDRLAIVLNFSDTEQVVTLPPAAAVVLSTAGAGEERVAPSTEVTLGPQEGLILDCSLEPGSD